jgi:hypothetical protein
VGDDRREGIKMFTNFACAIFSSDKTLGGWIPSEMFKEKCFPKKVDKEIGTIRVSPTGEGMLQKKYSKWGEFRYRSPLS